jgi:hypothetical protein
MSWLLVAAIAAYQMVAWFLVEVLGFDSFGKH